MTVMDKSLFRFGYSSNDNSESLTFISVRIIIRMYSTYVYRAKNIQWHIIRGIGHIIYNITDGDIIIIII